MNSYQNVRSGYRRRRRRRPDNFEILPGKPSPSTSSTEFISFLYSSFIRKVLPQEEIKGKSV
jgi:hypothetical protein